MQQCLLLGESDIVPFGLTNDPVTFQTLVQTWLEQ